MNQSVAAWGIRHPKHWHVHFRAWGGGERWFALTVFSASPLLEPLRALKVRNSTGSGLQWSNHIDFTPRHRTVWSEWLRNKQQHYTNTIMVTDAAESNKYNKSEEQMHYTRLP